MAHHEAGHALVRLHSPHAVPLHRVTIVPRGVAALGYTMHLPKEDRYMQTRSELNDELAAALGGRAAEEVVFGHVSTGAANDFQQATRIATAMVKHYGMSELGLVAYDDDNGQPQFLRQIMGGPPQYSERTAAEIDRQVRTIITSTYDRVLKILREQKPTLERIATTLLERESISGDELNQFAADAAPRADRFGGPAATDDDAQDDRQAL